MPRTNTVQDPAQKKEKTVQRGIMMIARKKITSSDAPT
jgi:hypothetical protein